MQQLRWIFLAFLAIPGTLLAQPQDRTQIEKERQDLQRELKEIEAQYNSVKKQTSQSVAQLNVITNAINTQERYLNIIGKEIHSIDDDIYLSNVEIYRLQKQLDTLKAQYAKTIVYAYKNRSSYDYLNFVFSANSFNDAVKRIGYLKSYRSYRERQVSNILETQALIQQRKQQQLVRKDKKQEAMDEQSKQVAELDKKKNEKAAVVAKLKTQEKDLSKQIAAKKKRDRDLNNAILAIIRRDQQAREAAIKAEKEKQAAIAAANNKPTNPVTNPATNPVTNKPTGTNPPANKVDRTVPVAKADGFKDLNNADMELSGRFEQNRARLPWPVDNGVVTYHFGINQIGEHLTTDNPGLTIATQSAGVPVKAVFDGEVTAIFNMGDGMAVTIRHGNYYTIYSNLASTSVAKGAQIKTGQSIGRAGNNEDGSGGMIDFIMMSGTRKIDPQPWLRR